MTPVEKAASAFISLFLAEVGYHEKASNAQLESPTANSGSANWNKFAAHIDSLRAKGLNFYNGRKNIGPLGEWCDISYDDTMIRFCQSLGLDELEAAKLAMQMLYQPYDSCGAGCEYSAGYYRAAGAWIERGGEPKTGDQIFFGKRGSETHTGGVVRSDNLYVYTVEGNANNQVMERRYARSDGNIAGYGRPNFAMVAYKFVDDDTPIEDDKESGMSENEIKKLFEKERKDRDKAIAKALDEALGPMIHNYQEIEGKTIRKEVEEMVRLGVIDGGTDKAVNPDDVNMREQLLRVLVVGKRFTIKSIAERFKSIANIIK